MYVMIDALGCLSDPSLRLKSTDSQHQRPIPTCCKGTKLIYKSVRGRSVCCTAITETNGYRYLKAGFRSRDLGNLIFLSRFQLGLLRT